MAAVDVGSLVDDLDPVSVTLERRGTLTSIDAYGDPVIPAAVETTITVAVHPATRKQIERAGLDHATDWRAFYAKVELRVADSAGPGDVIQHAGERWELISLADYGTMGGIWIALGKRIE